jgi:hypothetical protein
MVSRKGRNAEQPAHCRLKRIGRDELSAFADCECTWPDCRSMRSSPLQLAQLAPSRDVEVALAEASMPSATAVSAVAEGFVRKAHTRPWTTGSHS